MIEKINISQIIVDKSTRRQVDKSKVQALAESIKEIGLLNPVTINNNNELLAGLHRLEACKLLGYTKIETNSIGGGYLQYQLAEIDENLIRNELNVLERGEHLEKRKLIYEELYPETKNGANLQNLKNVKDNIEFIENINSTPKDSFVTNTAKLTGKSEPSIYQDLNISKNIAPEVKEIIRNEPIADKKTELLQLAKQEPETQKIIVEKIVNKEISKVNDYFKEPEIIESEPTIDYDLKEYKDDLMNVLNAYKTCKSPKIINSIKHLTKYLEVL